MGGGGQCAPVTFLSILEAIMDGRRIRGGGTIFRPKADVIIN